MKYIEQYLEDQLKIKALGKIELQKGDIWHDILIDGIDTGLRVSYKQYAQYLEKVIENPWGNCTEKHRDDISSLAEIGGGIVKDTTNEGSPTMECVDLGLPSGLKWATCNIGASKPEEYGDYFMWGSTTSNTDSVCNWVNTPYQTQDNISHLSTKFTKYLGSTSSKYKDSSAIDEDALKTVLDISDDAATVLWGIDYRMPTKEDFDELLANTTNVWATENGVNGRKFTASNGNSIFIPASGVRCGSSFYGRGSGGYVWSSSLGSNHPFDCRDLYFGSDDCGMRDDSRYNGFCVRPVSDM